MGAPTSNQQPVDPYYYEKMAQKPPLLFGKERHNTLNAASGKDSFGNYINPVAAAAAGQVPAAAPTGPQPWQLPFGDPTFTKLDTNMNPWMALQRQKNALDANANINTAATNTNIATGNAASELAASGGVDSGARERMFQGGELNRMNQIQGIRAGQSDANAQAALAGKAMEMDAKKTNMAAKNLFDSNLFDTKMKGYAAQKTGNAISSGGKGGLFG